MSGIYFTLQDMQNRLSQSGVSLRTDDLPPTTLGDVIDRAGSEGEQRCLIDYGPTALLASDWFHHRVTDIGCHLLARRRGNPSIFQPEHDDAILQLERVKAGHFQIPDVPPLRYSGPRMVNQRVVLRPFPRVLTEPSLSSTIGGPITDYQQKKDPLDWINNFSDWII